MMEVTITPAIQVTGLIGIMIGLLGSCFWAHGELVKKSVKIKSIGAILVLIALLSIIYCIIQVYI